MNTKWTSKRSSAVVTFLVAFAFTLTLLAPPSLAAEFYGIAYSFGKKPRNAYLDVSVDTAPGPSDVEFAVFNAGGVSLSQFTVRTNSYGLASSTSFGNLFDLSGGQPLLVRARTTATLTPSAATLYVDSIGAPLTIGLWPANRRDGGALAVGKEFGIAIGNFRSASLLIASVGGTDQAVDVHKGTRGADGSGIFSNGRLGPFGIWKVDLTQNEALSNLIVTSNGPIIVQVVIDDGRSPQSFMVLPSF